MLSYTDSYTNVDKSCDDPNDDDTSVDFDAPVREQERNVSVSLSDDDSGNGGNMLVDDDDEDLISVNSNSDDAPMVNKDNQDTTDNTNNQDKQDMKIQSRLQEDNNVVAIKRKMMLLIMMMMSKTKWTFSYLIMSEHMNKTKKRSKRNLKCMYYSDVA